MQPPSSARKCGSSYSGAHFRPSEVYGWRGTDARVYYLSPWEFMKWWELKKLQPPTTSEGSAERGLSEWVPSHGLAQSGLGVAQSGADKSAPAWKFGKDYRWREPLPPRMADKIVRLPSKNASQAAVMNSSVSGRTEQRNSKSPSTRACSAAGLRSRKASCRGSSAASPPAATLCGPKAVAFAGSP